MPDDRPLEFDQSQPGPHEPWAPLGSTDPARDAPLSFEQYPHRPAIAPEPVERHAFHWENPPQPGGAGLGPGEPTTVPPPLRTAAASASPFVSPPGFPPRASRRGVMAAMISGTAAAGLLAMVGLSAAGRDSGFAVPGTSESEMSETETGPPTLDVAGMSLTVPSGWTTTGSDDRVMLTKGDNQILVLQYSEAWGPAQTELLVALDRSDTPYRGPVGPVKDVSEGGVDRARSESAGTYRGKTARQIVELTLDPSSDLGLLVRQILTTKPGSTTADQAGQLISEIHEGWPT